MCSFGVLVGIYAIGAVLGGLIRSLLQMWPFGRQALAKILIFNLVAGNLFAIWHQGHLLGEHHEPQEREPLTPKGKLLRRRIFLFLLAELQRTMHSFCSCCRHLAARAAILLSLTCIMGPAPLPALDLLSLKWPRSHFAVFWFDLVGVLSYAIIVPQLNLFRHIGHAALHCSLDSGHDRGPMSQQLLCSDQRGAHCRHVREGSSPRRCGRAIGILTKR
eukprot:g8048.t1